MQPPRLPLSDRVLRRALRRIVNLDRSATLWGESPRNARGDHFDPILFRLSRVAALESRFRGAHLASREGLKRGMLITGSEPVELFRVERREVGGMPCVLYQPRPVPAGPVIYYLHGGGWTSGSDSAYDRFLRQLAVQSSLSVLAIDYPLAPEHRFPEALDRLIDAWPQLARCAPRWGTTSDRIILAGDSAGGNLAAALALAIRDRGLQLPARLGLIYPAVDLRRVTDSHKAFAEGYFLDASAIEQHLAAYAADPQDPRASVLLADTLAGLPMTVIVTAGFDPLRDEGEAFADRLLADGVEVQHLAFPTLPHGFVHFDGVSEVARQALRDVVKALTRCR